MQFRFIAWNKNSLVMVLPLHVKTWQLDDTIGRSYLAVLYDYLHQKLYNYHVIQADETPVLVNRDGRSAGSKSYMWVYRSGHLYTDKQIVLYDYHKTRNSSHPREFLRDYSGICVTDGYQVYHTIEKNVRIYRLQDVGFMPEGSSMKLSPLFLKHIRISPTLFW